MSVKSNEVRSAPIGADRGRSFVKVSPLSECHMSFETIDASQLAERWRVPKTWIRNWSRDGYANDPIPHVKLGKYVRFEWGSPALSEWWSRRRQ